MLSHFRTMPGHNCFPWWSTVTAHCDMHRVAPTANSKFWFKQEGWLNTRAIHFPVCARWSQTQFMHATAWLLPQLTCTVSEYTTTVPETTFSRCFGHGWCTVPEHGCLCSQSSMNYTIVYCCQSMPGPWVWKYSYSVLTSSSSSSLLVFSAMLPPWCDLHFL